MDITTMSQKSKSILTRHAFPLKIAFLALLFALTTFIFHQKSIQFLDPDFGWQVQTGNYILEHGFPQSDPFSYTMPSFKYVPHSWLSDIVFAKIFPHGGYSALSLITSILTTLSLFIVLLPRIKKSSMFSLALVVLLSITTMLPYISVRPQAFSWFFFSIVLVLTYEEKLWKRWGFLMPFIMILWVQLHGAFALGLGVIIFHRIYTHFILKKYEPKNIAIVLISCAATFVNPYGMRIWLEVFETYLDDKLRTEIAEWKPFILRVTEFHIPHLAIASAFIVKTRNNLPPSLVVFFLLLSLNALGSSKVFPFWVITATYLLSEALIVFFAKLTNPISVKRFSFIVMLLTILAASTLLLYIPRIWKTYDLFSEDKYYPKKSIEFIHANNLNSKIKGNFFAPFTWGGYVLWKNPAKKVFVDGRMTYWSQKRSLVYESYDAFVDETKFINQKVDPQKIINKYNLELLILPTTTLYKSKNVIKLATELKKRNWQELYRDDVSVILVSPDVDISL